MQQDSEEDPLCDGVLFLSPGTQGAYGLLTLVVVCGKYR